MGACQSQPAGNAAEITVDRDCHLGSEEAHRTFDVPEANVSFTVRSARRFGWQPDLPDFRDRFLNVAAHSKVRNGPLPASVDLRAKEGFPVYDQGHLGSCTANAIAAAFHYEQLRQGLQDFCPSRLFIYYNERAMEDHVDKDSGAMLRDGIICVNKFGVCDEAVWPYDIARFTAKPGDDSYAQAVHNTCKEYARVEQTLESLKGCLVAGHPFVFGFAVFSDIYAPEVKTTGIMKFPPSGKFLGGHAVQACGYDDARQCFIVRNSWGVGWGDQGHFYMPYAYMVHPMLCADFWAMSFVEGAEFPTKRHPRDNMPPLRTFSVPPGAACVPVRVTRRLGWKKDLPNIHDRVLDVRRHSLVARAALPAAVDLRPTESFPVYDQGNLGSCTANALAAAFQFEQLRQGLKAFTPSRLFIYYNERAIEDSVNEDAGGMLRDGIESLSKIGVCDEEATWPYDVSKFTQRPPAQAYQVALKNTAKKYARVEQTLDDLKGCLAAGYPFVFGFAVYSDIYLVQVQTTGVMSYPPQGMFLGGHAVQACGYDDEKKWFIVRNSWGEGWGDKGYFYMPYAFMTDPQLCADFWAINFVDGAEFPLKP